MPLTCDIELNALFGSASYPSRVRFGGERKLPSAASAWACASPLSPAATALAASKLAVTVATGCSRITGWGCIRRRLGDAECVAVMDGTAIMLLEDGERRPAAGIAEPAVKLPAIGASLIGAASCPTPPVPRDSAGAGTRSLPVVSAVAATAWSLDAAATTSRGATRRLTGRTLTEAAGTAASAGTAAAAAETALALLAAALERLPDTSDKTAGLLRRRTAGVSLQVEGERPLRNMEDGEGKRRRWGR
jgi:hypothetical protein